MTLQETLTKIGVGHQAWAGTDLPGVFKAVLESGEVFRCDGAYLLPNGWVRLYANRPRGGGERKRGILVPPWNVKVLHFNTPR